MKYLSVYLPNLKDVKYVFVKPCHLLTNKAFSGTKQQADIYHYCPELDIKTINPAVFNNRKAATV